MTTSPANLPGWAEELRRRYLRGEAFMFALHGNVHDLVLHEGKPMMVDELLCKVLLAATRDTIALYNTAAGVRFAKRRDTLADLDEMLLQRSRERVLPALERMLLVEDKAAVVLEYAETLAPAGDIALYSEGDRASLITLHRWSCMPALEKGDNIIVLIAENLSELHPRLVHNPRIATLRVPLPDEDARRALIQHLAPDLDSKAVERLTEITAGLKSVHIRNVLRPSEAEDDVDERRRYIASLLGASAAAERVDGLARITKGMSREEVRTLVAPDRPQPPGGVDALDEIVRIVLRHKREIIERECAGLLHFIEPKHDFRAVGGMDEVKRELGRVAADIRGGEVSRVPMGFLFVGPMGTGKTFVAEAFAKESGLTAVKFGSFRSKWVGATESNLERILDVLPAMGQVLVVIDEVDRALAGNAGSGDGGTESRVIARLKEFMSDTRNRGRILFVLMTNRPDLLDVDIKRTGRLDRKIPFFYPQTPEEVEPVLAALLRRHKLGLNVDLTTVRERVSTPLVGYSNADIEGVVMLAASIADRDGRRDAVAIADLQAAVLDYLPSRDITMLEYMELLAVFEASNKSMLPARYAELSSEELNERLQLARARVGSRR
ncbi:MAG: AAA family ATPase [Pseudomonadota bacterium]